MNDEPGHVEKRRTRLSHEVRREQIIEGAVSFFAETGLNGSTRELSRRLGITQSLLFAHFPTKGDLLEAVYRRVYLDRLSPAWQTDITDRTVPLRERMARFYLDYTNAIFTYEWMRIFMYSGLAGAELNRRYLSHMRKAILLPLLAELNEMAPAGAAPTEEDLWSLHGGIVYIGIRRYIYGLEIPANSTPAILNAIDRFLAGSGAGAPPNQGVPNVPVL